MKEFVKLKSGKEFNVFVNNMEEIVKLKNEISMPKVDIVVKLERTDKVSQYPIKAKAEQAGFEYLEDIRRNTIQEIEIFSTGENVYYTILEGDLKAVGVANIITYTYKDAVKIAMLRAQIELAGRKLNNHIQDCLVDRAKKVTRLMQNN